MIERLLASPQFWTGFSVGIVFQILVFIIVEQLP